MSTTFGKNLRRLRLDRGLSQTDLALAIGLLPKGRSRISDWETGRWKQPKVENALKLAEALDCSLDDLLRDHD